MANQFDPNKNNGFDPRYRRDGNGPDRYNISFNRPGVPFQFPWWAILFGFILWWPLGIAGIVANQVLRAQGPKNTSTTTTTTFSASAKKSTVTSTPAYSAKAAASSEAAKKKDSDGPANVMLTIGIILLAVGAIAFFSTVGDVMAYGLLGKYISDLMSSLVFIGCGGALGLTGHKMRVSWRMRRKLANIVGKADSMYIEDIAAAVPCSYEKCCKALEGCIERGVFGDSAYLDMRTRCLVVRGPAPVAKPQPAAEKTAAAKSPSNASSAKGNEQYQAILKELHTLNSAIPGEEMSDKIGRLETISAKIFQQAEASPRKLPQMRKFMDYYLPTALKLLKTYAELDAQGIEGDNISESKKRIEHAMDTLVVAFENQLDKLFQSDALDVSTDIDVMENMLAADGLTRNNDPFKLYRPQAPDSAAGHDSTGKQ